MLKTLINRCLQIIPALFVVVTLTFVLTRMIPGDPARAVAGPQASVQDVEKLRESMGLNEPMLVQYKDYVLGVLQGDFGTSYSYNQPVLKLGGEDTQYTSAGNSLHSGCAFDRHGDWCGQRGKAGFSV